MKMVKKRWYQGSIADKYVYSRLRKKGWEEKEIAKIPIIVSILAIIMIILGFIMEL